MERWRAPLFFPLMILRSTGIYVLSVQRLIRERNRAAGVEGALLALHVALYLTCVFWVLSPLKAVAFIAVQQAVFSVYLGCSFAPNHKGMPIVDSDAGLSFVRRQVVTSRNIVGGRFTNLLLGGLNYQIEHHLFPSMPRPNLARAQAIVRAFCLENNLGYRGGQPDRLLPPDPPIAAGGRGGGRRADARRRLSLSSDATRRPRVRPFASNLTRAARRRERGRTPESVRGPAGGGGATPAAGGTPAPSAGRRQALGRHRRRPGVLLDRSRSGVRHLHRADRRRRRSSCPSGSPPAAPSSRA